MKLNRRGFFGTMLGAAAAGPAVAQDAVKTFSVPTADAWVPLAGNVGYGSMSQNGQDPMRPHIINLIRRARGIKTEEDLSYEATWGGGVPIHETLRVDVDCLKSMSTISKHRMAKRLNKRDGEERTKAQAVHELLYNLKIPRALWSSYL